jgi:hypothetical protein
MAQAVSRQPRRSGFNPRSVHVEYVEDRVVLGWVLLRALLFSFVIVIPPVLHTHLHVSLTGGTNGRSLGTFQQAVLFREPGAFDRKLASHFSSLKA